MGGAAQGLLPLDDMLARALANRPGEVPLYMAFDNDQPSMTITTGPHPDSPGSQMTIQSFDRSTGELIGAVSEDSVSGVAAVMHFILELHTDMFLGLAGMLVVGVTGVINALAVPPRGPRRGDQSRSALAIRHSARHLRAGAGGM
jgi:uncharacterized iron-regulated membrane protein